MNKRVCYLLVGITGSGKSTIAKRLVEENPGAVVFSLDDLRLKLFEAAGSSAGGKEAYAAAFDYAAANRQKFDAVVNEAWSAALKADTVVVDNMNHTRKGRARWIAEARAKGFTVVAIDVMAPLEVLIERQAARPDKSVPAEVVKRAYYSYQELTADEADVVVRVNGITGLPM
jgi:predicted kinase